jgi:hypothetical protein
MSQVKKKVLNFFGRGKDEPETEKDRERDRRGDGDRRVSTTTLQDKVEADSMP